MERKNNILVVDDEKDIIKVLRLFLEKEGFNIYEAYDGAMAYEMCEKYEIDLVLLDIMMPYMNGYEFIKKVRLNDDVIIIVISAKVQLQDRILGLDFGADDYILKPFEPLEVVSRVKAHLRRINKEEKKIFKYNDMELNKERCILNISGQEVSLTKNELVVLEAFIKYPGKVFTKEELYECIWGDRLYAIDDNTIRVTISRIRDKIGEKRIKTIRGLGYRLEKHE